MKLVTLKLLLEKDTPLECINYFRSLGEERFQQLKTHNFSLYFRKVESYKLGLLKLIKRCRDDGEEHFENWLWRYITTSDEEEKIINYYITNGWDFDYAFRQKYLLNDLILFEKIINYYITNGWSLNAILTYCQEHFQRLPELYTKAKLYQRKYAKRKKTLDILLFYIYNLYI